MDIASREFLDIKTIAELWAAETGKLTAPEIERRLWQAIFRDEIHEGEFGFVDPDKPDKSIGISRRELLNSLDSARALPFDLEGKWRSPYSAPSDLPDCDRSDHYTKSDYERLCESIGTILEAYLATKNASFLFTDAILTREGLLRYCREALPAIGLPAFWRREDDVNLFRSGFAGRPSARGVIVQEFERRVAAENLEKSLAAQCRTLESWFNRAHPGQAGGSAKVIETAIRARWNQIKNPSKI